jgi:predicted phage-related endonuclease
MLNEAQRAAHYGGIGGSKVATVLGLDQYQSPLDYYHALVRFQDEGPPAEDRAPPSEAAVWGNLLENAIAQEWSRRRSLKVARVNLPRREREFPFLVANPDRLVRTAGARHGLEIKNRTAFKLNAYDAGPLESEVLQCQHYMRIFGVPLWSLAVLVGGQKMLDFDIKFDAELSALATTACVQFWEEHVVARRPPPPTRIEDLESYYARGKKGAVVVASPEVREALAALAETKAQMKALGERVGVYELAVKTAMLEATELTDAAGSVLATWRNNKDGEKTDWQALASDLMKKVAELGGVVDPVATVAAYTAPTVGARVFLNKVKAAAAAGGE